MPTTATRLLTLIQMLQRKPGQKAADLASQLGVSVRTLHRYFGMLDEMGVPVYAERGPYGGFSLVPGYKLPPLIFTPEEAVVLSLGTGLVREMWGKVFTDAAQGARAKLMNVLPGEQRQEIGWAESSLVTTGMNRADMQMLVPRLDMLRTAVRNSQRVHMVYQSSRNPAGEERDMDTYGLFHRSGWWYAVGLCHLRDEVRTFRVDRIMEMTFSESVFTRPADFDLRAYIAKDWQDVPGRACEAPVLAPHGPSGELCARGTGSQWKSRLTGPLWSSSTRRTCTRRSAPPFRTVLGLPCLEPPEARGMVSEWARAIADLYPDTEINRKQGD